MLKGTFDVCDGECDVVHPLTISLKKPADGRVWRLRFQELDVRAADGDHRLLNTLFGDNFTRYRHHVVLIGEILKRRIEIGHRDSDVVNVVREHQGRISAVYVPTGELATEPERMPDWMAGSLVVS